MKEASLIDYMLETYHEDHVKEDKKQMVVKQRYRI